MYNILHSIYNKIKNSSISNTETVNLYNDNDNNSNDEYRINSNDRYHDTNSKEENDTNGLKLLVNTALDSNFSIMKNKYELMRLVKCNKDYKFYIQKANMEISRLIILSGIKITKDHNYCKIILSDSQIHQLMSNKSKKPMTEHLRSVNNIINELRKQIRAGENMTNADDHLDQELYDEMINNDHDKQTSDEDIYIIDTSGQLLETMNKPPETPTSELERRVSKLLPIGKFTLNTAIPDLDFEEIENIRKRRTSDRQQGISCSSRFHDDP